MLTPETIEKMNAMKLFGLVSAFETQLSSSEYKELSFEERVGLLVDAEWTAREQRKLSRRLRAAKLRYPACLENVNFQAPRGLNREQILSLGNCRFVGERHNLLITGPTGIGKSFLACAFVERACRRGFTGCYVRAPRLLHELAVARGDGSYARLLTKLAKLDLLAIDDWLLHPLKESERRDLMKVIEDRAERGSTLIATQIPLKQWHEAIGDPNQADAERVSLSGPGLECRGERLRQRGERELPGAAYKADQIIYYEFIPSLYGLLRETVCWRPPNGARRPPHNWVSLAGVGAFEVIFGAQARSW